MAESPPFLCYTIYHDRIRGLTVTAGRGSNGQWIVNFMRRCKMYAQCLYDCAHWLPSGRWDDSRWHPVGARLVPPAALEVVESWLMARAVVGVAS